MPAPGNLIIYSERWHSPVFASRNTPAGPQPILAEEQGVSSCVLCLLFLPALLSVGKAGEGLLSQALLWRRRRNASKSGQSRVKHSAVLRRDWSKEGTKVLLRSSTGGGSVGTQTGKFLPQVVPLEPPHYSPSLVRWRDEKHFLWEMFPWDRPETSGVK